MNRTSDMLFDYLSDLFAANSETKPDVDMLEKDFKLFGQGITYFTQCFVQFNEFTKALSGGDFGVQPPVLDNELRVPKKSVHANLKHLSSQSKKAAQGDYKQHVDFMSEFSDAFNKMIMQLTERQEKLEKEIVVSKQRMKALEQSNRLLNRLTRYIPQQIFVVTLATNEILLYNDMAAGELENDSAYVPKIMDMLPTRRIAGGSRYVELKIEQDGRERYLLANYYFTKWNNISAVVLVINDVSSEKMKMKALEEQAYRDTMTNKYNRFYGMITLNEWLEQKKQFSLVFVDLDNLKYVNDEHGHFAGDEYIIRVSDYLASFSPETVLCRIGGDEFMMLIPNVGYAQACCRMSEISDEIENDQYLNDEKYSYSISTGVITIDENNELSSSSILSIADERMYEHKRAKKKERRGA